MKAYIFYLDGIVLLIGVIFTLNKLSILDKQIGSAILASFGSGTVYPLFIDKLFGKKESDIG